MSERDSPEPGLAQLRVSTRIKDALQRHGVETIRQLTEMSREELLALHGIGRIGVIDIRIGLRMQLPPLRLMRPRVRFID